VEYIATQTAIAFTEENLRVITLDKFSNSTEENENSIAPITIFK